MPPFARTLNVFGTMSLCVVLAALSGTAAFAQGGSVALPAGDAVLRGSPFFILVASPPAISSKVNARDGDVVYRQILRPFSGLRSSAAFRVQFTPEDYRKGYDIDVPAGTIFLTTIVSGQQLFCAARSFENSIWDTVEAAVCLQDINADGVADRHVVFGRDTRRVRHIYEFTGDIKNAPFKAVAVAYEGIPVDALPQIRIEALAVRKGGLNFGSRWALEMRAYVPAEIATELEDDVPYSFVGWDGDQADYISRTQVRADVDVDKSGTATVRWGAFSFSVSDESRDFLSVKALTGLPVGLIAEAGEGEITQENAPSYMNATALLRFVPLKAPPAASANPAGQRP